MVIVNTVLCMDLSCTANDKEKGMYLMKYVEISAMNCLLASPVSMPTILGIMMQYP